MTFEIHVDELLQLTGQNASDVERALSGQRDLESIVPYVVRFAVDPLRRALRPYSIARARGDFQKARADVTRSLSEVLSSRDGTESSFTEDQPSGDGVLARFTYDDLIKVTGQESSTIRTAVMRDGFDPNSLLSTIAYLVRHGVPALRLELVRELFHEAPAVPTRPPPPYDLKTCAEDTGIELPTLKRWANAIERKKQAVLYGPPGTGKTFFAKHFAKHLVRGVGFVELVQFHPAYAYEDFVQGVRPRAREDGALSYPLVPGRFLDFCRRARGCDGPCVMIIDEINRANLSRVFGELMYLLEYRDEQVPLAAGGQQFQIPSNVRLLGTMNTADRSIALVDHALRRRFAFLPLYPNYEIVRTFHESTEFNVQSLIDILRELNDEIGDKHYRIGTSFFLVENLAGEIEDVWRMEIEPYLEEFFFAQSDKVEMFRWEKVQSRLLP